MTARRDARCLMMLAASAAAEEARHATAADAAGRLPEFADRHVVFQPTEGTKAGWMPTASDPFSRRISM